MVLVVGFGVVTVCQVGCLLMEGGECWWWVVVVAVMCRFSALGCRLLGVGAWGYGRGVVDGGRVCVLRRPCAL